MYIIIKSATLSLSQHPINYNANLFYFSIIIVTLQYYLLPLRDQS